MSIRVLSAAALLATLAHSANVHVHNQCDFNVQLIPSQSGADHDTETLASGKTYTAPAGGSAWCLKLTPEQGGSYASDSPTQLEWSVWNPGNGDILSYDLSDINVNDATSFLQHGMNLTSEDPTCDTKESTCRPAICNPQTSSNVQPCVDAYNQPYDTRTLGASASYDINLVLCTGSDSSSSSSGSSGSSGSPDSSSAPAYSAAPSPSPAAAPPAAYTTLATSAAPAAPPAPSSYDSGAKAVQVDSNGNAYEGDSSNNADGNVVTAWVQNTQVVTQVVTARNAEPTIEKRHMHHAHGHHHNAQ